jgi:hypothetical protein
LLRQLLAAENAQYVHRQKAAKTSLSPLSSAFAKALVRYGPCFDRTTMIYTHHGYPSLGQKQSIFGQPMIDNPLFVKMQGFTRADLRRWN